MGKPQRDHVRAATVEAIAVSATVFTALGITFSVVGHEAMRRCRQPEYAAQAAVDSVLAEWAQALGESETKALR